MGDQDFNFPPTERREPKQFEPPPWEREAFEELTRAREAEELIGAAEAARGDAPGVEAEVIAEVPVAEPEEGAAAPQPAVQPAPDAAAEQAAPSKTAVSEAELTEMMAGLRAEEPTSMQSYGAIAIALSVFTGLVGIVMLVWAMAMFVSARARGTGRVGLIGGSIVALFGALFIGLSMWVALRTLRQRGVL